MNAVTKELLVVLLEVNPTILIKSNVTVTTFHWVQDEPWAAFSHSENLQYFTDSHLLLLTGITSCVHLCKTT